MLQFLETVKSSCSISKKQSGDEYLLFAGEYRQYQKEYYQHQQDKHSSTGAIIHIYTQYL